MARVGWDCKSGAAVIGCEPTKFTQAMARPMEVILSLYEADAHKTLLMIADGAERRKAIRAMDEASDAELALRERILSGRANRSELQR